jgi:hypothetical protein
VAACNAEFDDCNGSAADGCEASLNTSQNCGSCGEVCGSGESCAAGSCVPCPETNPQVSGQSTSGTRLLCRAEVSGGSASTLIFERVSSDGACDTLANTINVSGISMTGVASGSLGLCAVQASGNKLSFLRRRDDGDGVVLCDSPAGTITLNGAAASGSVSFQRGLCKATTTPTSITFFGQRDDGDGVLVCDGMAGTITLAPVCTSP